MIRIKRLLAVLVALILIPSVIAQGALNEPIWILGITLGLSDGIFNPCALSVLLFLIAYLMALGSKKKCLIIGFIYSLIIFIIYFSFMYGILYGITNISEIAKNIELLKTVVGIALIIFGAIELKDFFFYGKGVSLEIPGFAKPKIEKLVKAATIPSALALGFLVSLVEIPCAGAFPFTYTTILASSGMSLGVSILYLLWYNIFFVVPLLALVLVFYLGLVKVEAAEEKRLKLRKYMRLVAGIIMISLAVAMLMRWL